jgi:hypothetical protein
MFLLFGNRRELNVDGNEFGTKRNRNYDKDKIAQGKQRRMGKFYSLLENIFRIRNQFMKRCF